MKVNAIHFGQLRYLHNIIDKKHQNKETKKDLRNYKAFM